MSIIFAARCAEHPEKRNPKVLGIPGYGRHGLLLINGGRSEPVNGDQEHLAGFAVDIFEGQKS
jgi:hypothetical protein